MYGGEDGDTVQKIEDCLKKIRKDGIPVEFINANEIKSFYARLESCMLSKMQTKADVHDSLMGDLLNLYTNYKKNRGFTIACVGSRVLVNTSLATASEVLFKYESTWRKNGKEMGMAFESAFKECYDNVFDPPTCHRFYIPNMVGCISEIVECADCHTIMTNIVMFECCHGKH